MRQQQTYRTTQNMSSVQNRPMRKYVVLPLEKGRFEPTKLIDRVYQNSYDSFDLALQLAQSLSRTYKQSFVVLNNIAEVLENGVLIAKDGYYH